MHLYIVRTREFKNKTYIGIKIASQTTRMIVDIIILGGGSGSTSSPNTSSGTQDTSLKSGKAPLAVGDMLVALPETSTRDRSPDLTSNTKHIDGRVPPSSDYYA